MSEDTKTFQVQSAALTDRGLNERRPLNEDALLHDQERSIFAVADGVGGAEAGEVASQTAIEVLDEAFRHQVDGADVEDLMELAIQRANASIHQMAQEHAKFSMMATTIVALHLKGNVATFGHVGDSRLYRLTPDGQLRRETEDHSIVEEEVRAGRMTPEQAANHPSKNVISRALGAEQGVEVDMKTIEVEDGTEFLLCTDGITRHVSDNELRQLMVVSNSLEDLCDELKRRCYERGAEDNLTVIVVRVGEHLKAGERLADLEPTITPETEPVYAAQSSNGSEPENTFVPASRIAFPAPASQAAVVSEPLNVAAPPAKGGSGVGRLLGVVVVLLLIGGAFYAGARYKERIPFLATKAQPATVATPASTPILEEPFVKFERARRQVDQDPRAWLASDIGKELLESHVQNPLDSPNAEFLYLYGRANLLTGNTDEASKAFDAAISKANLNPTPANATIKKEAVLGLAAVSVRTQRDRWKVLNHYEELTKPPANSNAP
ncbi:MAG TPA: PP2C family serine/threonine-protein phosphatase [Pyrinomonadaceae bacterium]|jgi:protein phosphatase|nr:PP2C family serine/threonine-protein phosphatase [Pyrinomonadaceae bacterium]